MAASIPVNFKPLQHYIKTAVEHDKRDPVVSYYCRLYALQRGMEIDKKSPDCRNYLASLMNLLEEAKHQHQDKDAIQNEIVGQAHLENYALKLFLYADNEDRAGRFGKNVVKSFYTAGMLMDVLTNFGEISEDIEKNRKYAKWKAAYIHNCLKNGETPISGPLPEDGDVSELGNEFAASDLRGVKPMEMGDQHQPSSSASLPGGMPSVSGYGQPPASGYSQPQVPGFGQPQGPGGFPQQPPSSYGQVPNSHPVAAPRNAQPQVPYSQPAAPANVSFHQPVAGAVGGSVTLKPEDYTRAMKLCKFATSALQYEDQKTAIENLMKALNLLTTGHE